MVSVASQAQVPAVYVDDEPLLLNTMRRTLGPMVALDTFSDATEAIDRIREREYPIVITDLRMPQHDGIEVLRVAREVNNNCYGILVSARGDYETAIIAINEVRAFRFFPKPWSTKVLREAVETAVRLIRIREENERLRHALEERNDELQELTDHLDHEVAERTASALRGLIRALDLRDTETQSHSRRVALFARLLAGRIGLPLTECIEIERGALLHDIGKIGVSDTILRKPGKLTDTEWVAMRQHAVDGARILEKLSFLGRARDLVAQHHEQWSGKGYPHGLAGEQIYIGARIFAIIDAYDAITSDRPYRPGASHEEAIREIQKCAGVQFDPQLVAHFVGIPAVELEVIRKQCAVDENQGFV